MADTPIRVGFVGAGANTRKHHIPKLKAQPGVELVAVANRSKESGERVAKEFGIARVEDDWRRVVEAKDVDAICIGTWPYMHRELTVAALAAGKHVLCEARMAMNAAEGRQMLEASRKAPRLVAQLVPAPHTLELDSTLQKLLAEGYAGEVHAVEVQATQQARFAELGDAMHWRQDIRLSGNNILNMGIWYEAMMRWLGPARRVMAMTKVAVPRRKDETGAWQEVKVPDHVDILVTFKSGAVGHLRFSSLTALAPPPEVASAVPADAGEAARATALTVRDASRQLVYRLQDGRTFVLLQSHPGSDRPFLSSYSLDEGSVRGYPAQLITTRSRVLRSLISWTEGPAAYLMYSGSLTVRELVRLAEQLR